MTPTLLQKPSYIPSLNIVRALSIFLVILFHWNLPILNLQFGWIGVNIFFVLSGFLITRILVYEKEQPFPLYIQQFYTNRSLRIFPIYYLFIAALVVYFILLPILFPSFFLNEKLKLLANSLSSSLGFLLSYTYNYIFIADSNGNWIGREFLFTGPFWTLSIEEQFYLVFPFVVYFLNKRTLKNLVVGIILLVPLFRLLWGIGGKIYFNFEYENYLIGEQIYKFTFLQADSLATGAALALFDFKWIKNSFHWFIISLSFLFFIGLFNLFILKSSGSKLDWACMGYEYPGHWLVNICNWKFVNLRYVYNYSIINLTAGLFILSVVQGKLYFGLLHNSFILYLGQISYGIYIYHQGLLAIFSENILPKLLFIKTLCPLFISESITFILYFVLLFTISHLSYVFIERTFLKMKTHH